jgi:hypothetical protein
MKPEDLEHGKEYLITPTKEIDIFGDVSDRPFYGKFQELKGGNANFLVIHPVTDTYKSFLINKFWIKQLKEIEKTMPAPRKPERITLKLTQDEIIKALSSLGYDLEGYTIGYSEIELPFKLKKTFTPVVTASSSTIGCV